MNIFRPWLQIQHLPRQTWLLYFSMFINRAGHMALPFLVLYLTSEKKFSPTEAGFVLTLYGFASIGASVLSGYLCDHVDPKNIMRISLLGTASVIASIPWLATYSQIVIAALFWAFFAESFRPANMTLLNGIASPSNRKLIFSFHRFFINLGMSIGPALGGFLAERSFHSVFYFNATFTFLAGLILVLYPFGSHRLRLIEAESHAETLSHRPGALQNTRYLLFLSGIILMVFVYAQHESTLGIFLVNDLHQTRSRFGLLFTINTLMIVALEIPLNVRLAHWPHSRSLFLGGLLYAIGFGSLAFAREFWMVCLGVVIWTFGEMIESPAVSASVSDFAPRKKIGQYMGLLTMSYGVAFCLAPLVGTLVYEKMGSQALWILCAGVGVIAAFILGTTKKERRRG